MRALILVSGIALTLSACGSAPSEEAPTAPVVVCEEEALNESCPTYDNVVTSDDIKDGNVVTPGEVPHQPTYLR